MQSGASARRELIKAGHSPAAVDQLFRHIFRAKGAAAMRYAALWRRWYRELAVRRAVDHMAGGDPAFQSGLAVGLSMAAVNRWTPEDCSEIAAEIGRRRAIHPSP